MLPIIETDIPEGVIIPCPLEGFANKKASKRCPTCPHFEGIAQMGTEGSWSQQHVIRCAHVIERRTINLSDID